MLTSIGFVWAELKYLATNWVLAIRKKGDVKEGQGNLRLVTGKIVMFFGEIENRVKSKFERQNG